MHQTLLTRTWQGLNLMGALTAFLILGISGLGGEARAQKALSATASTDLDPAGGNWTATSSLTQPHAYATATLLPDGRVFVVGGYDFSIGGVTSSELFDASPARSALP